jgi:hypothetical protein
VAHPEAPTVHHPIVPHHVLVVFHPPEVVEAVQEEDADKKPTNKKA